MPEQPSPLPLPPEPRTRDGSLRRIGVELEMKGLDIATMSSLVADHVGGEVEEVSRYEHVIRGDDAGDWQVELDFAYLKQRGRDERAGEGVLAQLDDAAEELIAAGSEALVPMEVVSPPLPMDRLADLERLIAALRDAGARGTRDGLTFAFGTHLNPEMPATDAATVTRYLKAFLCLFDWLRAEARVDLLRRLSPYIDPFPVEYVQRVIDPDYQPDADQLIDDYLRDNPTRNRALDMLPLFAFMDEDRVRSVVDDPRIKARPALHYRLPNCEIDEPGWGVRHIWSDWLQVEHLAADPERLDSACRAYQAFLDRPVGRLVDDWAERVSPWLKDPDDL
ncbi:MAG: amidoligase family protein [Pseudomonadales bacterium]